MTLTQVHSIGHVIGIVLVFVIPVLLFFIMKWLCGKLWKYLHSKRQVEDTVTRENNILTPYIPNGVFDVIWCIVAVLIIAMLM